MNEEINNLKLEIEVLKKRVASLESIERRRKISKIIKIAIYVVILIAVAMAGYKFYQQMSDYYNNINNMLTNPFSAFTDFTKKT